MKNQDTNPDIVFFDTETTGLPPRGADIRDAFIRAEVFPHIVQLAWRFRGVAHCFIIRPDGWTIPDAAARVHGITTEHAAAVGVPWSVAAAAFLADCAQARALAAHNATFDDMMLRADFSRCGVAELAAAYEEQRQLERIDTMFLSCDYVGARFADGTPGKWPTLQELHVYLFGRRFDSAHSADADTLALENCFIEMQNRGWL